jgi:tetratricopeptide (TPR) repeat protein
MAKKKKNIKKKIKEKQQYIAKLTFDDLLKKGDKHTLDKKPRDAIKMYKLAIKNSKSEDQVQMGHCKLFLAYMQRAEELIGKNMLVEAASLRKQAMNYLPAPDVMDQRSIAFVIELCDLGKAFNYCEQYIARTGSDPVIGALLADRLVTQGGWEFLDDKETPCFISRDAPVVKASLPLMDKGQWQQASDEMKALPRTSAFAHIRMFCRAMALFGQGDDKNMYKAISLIPEASVFAKIAAVLGTTVQSVNEKAPIKENKALAACLWEGPLDAWETAEKIIEKAEKNQFDKTMQQLIMTFSKQILPDDPEYAGQYLVETLWHRGITNEKAFAAFEKALLPRKAALLQTKRKILSMDNPLDHAAQYLDLLKKTVSDPQTLAMVESAVFLYVCRAAVSESNQDELMRLSNKTATRFGLSPGQGIDTLWMQCAARGIQCDARNKELYELVIQKNVRAREPKKIKENLLLSMCEAFPDDPYPCIELASLYHGKNAFRKAENILKKAMELAPYDSRVQDMHIISLVISADKSINKGNFERARQDLAKAQELDTGTNALLLREKELFYQICEKPRLSEKSIGSNLDQLSLCQRLKLVCMLRMDVEDKPKNDHSKVFHKIGALFKTELIQVSRLTSEELLTLLTPFPREWQHVFTSLKVHQMFLETSTEVLKYLNSDDLIGFMDRVLSSENWKYFKRELQRRIEDPKEDPNHDLLVFYIFVMEGIWDNEWDVDELIDLVEDADSDLKKKFKAAGERLSRHTHGPYRHALQNLEFELLDELFADPFDLFDPFDDYDYDDDYDDDDDGEFNPFDFLPKGMVDIEDLKDPFIKNVFSAEGKRVKREDPEMYREMFEQLKRAMEEIIDDEGLRGAPKPVLDKFKKNMIKENQEITGFILLLNLIFGDEGRKKLSREAKTIFIQ